MEVFFGVPANEGIGIGTAFVIPEPVVRAISQHRISIDQLNKGWQRFEQAIQSVIMHLSEQLDSLPKNDPKDKIQREVLETYILMLGDPVFNKEVRDYYEKELYNIEYTVQYKSEEYAERLSMSGNDYLAERSHDITDVFGLVLDEMLDIHPFDINQVPDGSVILASSLNSADAIILSKRKIAGIALSEGGVTSHVVILARNYGIPTVVGMNQLFKQIRNGETVIIDGKQAELLVSPDKDTIIEYKGKIQEEYKRKLELRAFLDKPAQTSDGVKFSLLANIGTPEEAEIAKAEGADGIGLFRTEFLYMSQGTSSSNATARSFSEENQLEAYKRVLETMGDKPVTIRTLDAGGDKLINSVDVPHIQETNPLMGLRAVRMSLAYPQVLKTQLRALFRASVYGNLKIMFPLITSVEQVRELLKIVETVKKELKAENKPFNENLQIGIMIETAAAAIVSDCLSKVCDFFSLGTNDLTQYTLAVDRENQRVANLYDEFHLAVLRLIEKTALAAKEANIPVAVCGEMASRQDSILVLAGMGIRNLSMSPKLISSVKELLSRFTIKELEAFSDKRFNNL